MYRVIPLFVLDDARVRQFAPAIMPATRQASAPREEVAPASLEL